MSLENLCKTFGVVGKFSSYNPEFNKLKMFNNKELLTEFISYAKQDSESLFNAMIKL